MLRWTVAYAILAALAAMIGYGGILEGAGVGLAKLVAIIASTLFAIATLAMVVRH